MSVCGAMQWTCQRWCISASYLSVSICYRAMSCMNVVLRIMKYSLITNAFLLCMLTFGKTQYTYFKNMSMLKENMLISTILIVVTGKETTTTKNSIDLDPASKKCKQMSGLSTFLCTAVCTNVAPPPNLCLSEFSLLTVKTVHIRTLGTVHAVMLSSECQNAGCSCWLRFTR